MTKKIKIKVIPRSGKNEIVSKLPDETIKIKLKAPPVDGEANNELIKFLSKQWKVPKSNITILKGKTSKTKLIEIKK